MSSLRAYLLVRLAKGDWAVTVHRDIESLLDSWRPFEKTHAGAIVHVGFWRPETEAFEAVAEYYCGRVLLSASARYALPTQYKVSVTPLGEVNGIPLYLGLNGWGYEIKNEPAAKALDSSATSNPLKPDCLRPEYVLGEDWWVLFAQRDPDLAREARACGICDEVSYHSHESTIHGDLRARLAWARIGNASGPSTSAKRVDLDRLRYGPAWLLSLPISALNLSVRSNNCMRVKSVLNVLDLARLGEETLLTLPNLGRKSVVEIGEKVAQVFCAGPTDPMVRGHLKESNFAPRNVSLHSSSAILSLQKGPAPELAEKRGHDLPMALNLKDAFEAGLALLDHAEVQIMRLRMGFEGKPRTLQEIGDKFSVTRERIRQKERRCVGKINRHPVWRHDLKQRLDKMLSGRMEPLPLLGLEILDPWFVGAEALAQPLDYALSRFCEARFSLLRTRGQLFVSRLTQANWEEAVKEARLILSAEIERAPRESEVRSLVDAVLIGVGEEMRPELWTEATRWANFATPDGTDKERILVSFGFGAESIVEVVLMESDRPLHYTEIARHCRERLAKPVDVRRAHNSAGNVGLLFARGTYGLMKHFPLDESEQQLLVAEVEDLIDGGDPNKQWHAREIAEVMEERGLDFSGRLTPYIVSIALENSRNLANLGRMVWASRSAGAPGTIKRIDVRQAVVALLLAEGRPMRSDEIRERIARDRGLNCYFQIQPQGALMRMGVGLWGLANRDLPFSEAEGEIIVDAIVGVLTDSGKGLHISEIGPSLKPTVPLVTRVQDPVLFLGLAQRDTRCSVSTGQYVFLRNWGESRRLTVLESVRRALTAAGSAGLTLQQCHAASEALIERPLPRSLIGFTCSHVGASYDETNMRWTLVIGGDDTYGADEVDLESA